MHVKDFLKSNPPEALTEKLGIAVKRHPKYQNLMLCNYSQIDSPKSDPVVIECRGLILDQDNDFHPVNFPYRRFLNHGEAGADIDWSTARVQEKLDGTLVSLWYYNNAWHVSTRGTPDAGGNVGNAALTFADLFWKVWKELDYRLPLWTDSAAISRCYMFELMTSLNRIIVVHDKPRIVHHGARNLVTLEEIDPRETGAAYGWEVVEHFPVQTAEDVVKWASTLSPTASEGFVAVDAAWRRVKVKSPQYVALSGLIDGFGPRRMLEIILTNESDEFLLHFPEFRKTYDEVRRRFDTLIKDVEETFEQIKGIEIQKDFALEAQKTKYPGFLFALRSKKADNAHHAAANMNIKFLAELLKIDEV